ncbi:MAG: hypothetical protein KBS74_08705 [Clostridiales bacterium]|nr:hypothetical protein [Candidatus Cacconaster stercorequi]
MKLPALLWLGIALALYILIKCALIFTNRRWNGRHDIVYSPGEGGALICNQAVRGSPVSRLRYGRKRMAWNGCEVIAVYNAMVLLRRQVSLSALVTRFQLCGAMVLLGYFGSMPAAMGTVLRRSRIPYTTVRSPAALQSPGLYIVSYWTGRRWRSHLHTVALTYDGRRWTAYNTLPGVPDHRPPASYLRGGFIRGYALGPLR